MGSKSSRTANLTYDLTIARRQLLVFLGRLRGPGKLRRSQTIASHADPRPSAVQRGYWVIDRDDGESTAPRPNDPRTTSPSMCQHDAAGAFTYDEAPNDDYGGPGTDAWLGNQVTILCPGTFDVEIYAGDDRAKLRVPQPIGTHLDTMGTVALAFLHELFHVARPDFADSKSYFCKFHVDAHGRKTADSESVRAPHAPSRETRAQR